MSQLPSVAENHCQRMEREECRSRKHNYYSNAMNQRQGKKRKLSWWSVVGGRWLVRFALWSLIPFAYLLE